MEPKTILRNAFQLLAEGVDGDALILLDMDGTILSWNQQAQLLKGYTAQEIIGQHISILYSPKDRQSGLPRLVLNEAKIAGHVIDAGQRVRRNGTMFWGSIEVTAIKDDSGTVIGYTGRIAEIDDETDSWHFWFDNDGILHIKAHRIFNSPAKIAEFRKLVLDNVSTSGKISCIADLREATVTDEGMDFSKPGVADIYKAIAYITNSLVDPVTEKVVAALTGKIPIAVFNARPAAKAWIKQYRSEP